MFGDEVVACNKIQDLSELSNYHYIITQTNYPDQYGNGSFVMSIHTTNEKTVQLTNGWTLKKTHGGWDWNSYWVHIDLEDSKGLMIQVTLRYPNPKKCETTSKRSILDTLKKILEVGTNYTNTLEYNLLCEEEVAYIKHYQTKGDLLTYNKLRNWVNKFFDIYTKCLNDPTYHNITERHQNIIQGNVISAISKLLNYQIEETKKE